MYNFFANRTHKRAFARALKEVEREGYYVSGDTSDDMVFTTNMSRAVAALSDDQIPVRPLRDKTLDVSALSTSDEPQPLAPSKTEIVELESKDRVAAQKNANLTPRVKPADAKVVENQVYTKQSRAQIYEKMFSDDALLSGEHIKERGLLTSETSDDDMVDFRKLFSSGANSSQSKANAADEDLKKRTKKYLADLNAQVIKKREEEKAAKAAEIKVDEPLPVIDEKADFDAIKEEQPEELTMPVVEAQEQEIEKDDESLSVAEIDEIIKKQEVVVKPEKVKKPKTSRTRKKRRRYDADIAGGFNF